MRKKITIQDLYPNFSPEELAEAEYNLDRYVELCVRIYERIRLDPVAYAEWKLLKGVPEGEHGAAGSA